MNNFFDNKNCCCLFGRIDWVCGTVLWERDIVMLTHAGLKDHVIHCNPLYVSCWMTPGLVHVNTPLQYCHHVIFPLKNNLEKALCVHANKFHPFYFPTKVETNFLNYFRLIIRGGKWTKSFCKLPTTLFPHTRRINHLYCCTGDGNGVLTGKNYYKIKLQF